MVEYKFNEPYYKLHFSELEEDVVKVLSFEGEERISRLFEYQFELLSEDAELDPEAILNKKATFIITRGDEEPLKIHGIISHFEQRGRTPDYVSYYAVLTPKMWRLLLTRHSEVYKDMDIEKLVTTVLKNSEFSADDFKFDLAESYPEMEYVVQYRETHFNFINRRLEHFGIFYYFDHRDDNDVIVFTDNNDALSHIDQDDDIYYNPNRDPLSKTETISDLIFRGQVVTGLVRLKDYNYLFPEKQMLVESQINADDPGTYYEYGDHFLDENEGELLAKIRNEEIIVSAKVFKGNSDCRLFRAGCKFKMGKHYREDWNSDYLITRVILKGTQRGLFGILPETAKILPTYQNYFEAIPTDIAYRAPRITPVPKIYGIMSGRVESSANDEYAYIDDQGRYRVKMFFDLEDKNQAEATLPIRLTQPYSGPDYGIHFPNHADTELLWGCVDGNVDRPVGLGTVPNPSNAAPSTSANKAQSVIRTAAQNELTLDDTTGSENIYLHGTKDWTIDIVNDKKQTIGNDETSSVGNNRSREVGNNETISVGANRDKTVGANQTETIGANKTISVGANHSETISANMSQTVSIAKAVTVGAAYQISVGAAMNETVGAIKAEEIGGNKTVMVGADSSENVGANKSLNAGKDISKSAGKNYSCQAGEDFTIQSGKKMMLSAGDDFGIKGDKKGIIEIKDQLTLKCGKASITMKKNGDISIEGKKINIKGSGDVILKGKKILGN